MIKNSTVRKGAISTALVAALVAGFAVQDGSRVRLDVHAEAGGGHDSDDQQVGRQADGSVVVTTNQVLTPAGRQVEFRGRPLSVALSPDGRTAAFLNGTYQAVILVDV